MINRIKTFLHAETVVLSKQEKWIYIGIIGMFIFLFMLFFQPFGVNNYDPKETITLQFVIVMLIMGMVTSALLAINEFIFFPRVIKNPNRLNMLIWILWSLIWLSSGIFLSYNFMGNWHDMRWSSYLEFIGNISALGIIPIIALLFYTEIRSLQQTLIDVAFQENGKTVLTKEMISIMADNGKDRFSIPLKNLIYLESDDNYVSIYHLQNEQITKSLLRKSLKKIQEEKISPALVRCHRSYIINTYQLERIVGNRNKLNVYLRHLSKPLPVSRQYMDDIFNLHQPA